MLIDREGHFGVGGVDGAGQHRISADRQFAGQGRAADGIKFAAARDDRVAHRAAVVDQEFSAGTHRRVARRAVGFDAGVTAGAYERAACRAAVGNVEFAPGEDERAARRAAGGYEEPTAVRHDGAARQSAVVDAGIAAVRHDRIARISALRDAEVAEVGDDGAARQTAVGDVDVAGGADDGAARRTAVVDVDVAAARNGGGLRHAAVGDAHDVFGAAVDEDLAGHDVGGGDEEVGLVGLDRFAGRRGRGARRDGEVQYFSGTTEAVGVIPAREQTADGQRAEVAAGRGLDRDRSVERSGSARELVGTLRLIGPDRDGEAFRVEVCQIVHDIAVFGAPLIDREGHVGVRGLGGAEHRRTATEGQISAQDGSAGGVHGPAGADDRVAGRAAAADVHTTAGDQSSAAHRGGFGRSAVGNGQNAAPHGGLAHHAAAVYIDSAQVRRRGRGSVNVHMAQQRYVGQYRRSAGKNTQPAKTRSLGIGGLSHNDPGRLYDKVAIYLGFAYYAARGNVQTAAGTYGRVVRQTAARDVNITAGQDSGGIGDAAVGDVHDVFGAAEGEELFGHDVGGGDKDIVLVGPDLAVGRRRQGARRYGEVQYAAVDGETVGVSAVRERTADRQRAEGAPGRGLDRDGLIERGGAAREFVGPRRLIGLDRDGEGSRVEVRQIVHDIVVLRAPLIDREGHVGAGGVGGAEQRRTAAEDQISAQDRAAGNEQMSVGVDDRVARHPAEIDVESTARVNGGGVRLSSGADVQIAAAHGGVFRRAAVGYVHAAALIHDGRIRRAARGYEHEPPVVHDGRIRRAAGKHAHGVFGTAEGEGFPRHDLGGGGEVAGPVGFDRASVKDRRHGRSHAAARDREVQYFAGTAERVSILIAREFAADG